MFATSWGQTLFETLVPIAALILGSLVRLSVRFGKLEQRIVTIDKQVTPNGGTSSRLGDQVLQARMEVRELSKRLDEVKGVKSVHTQPFTIQEQD